MSGIDFIQDLGVVMLVASVAGWLCQRIGVPAVLGYISSGILISPHTHAFGLVSDTGRIQSLAQIGLVFLIFGIGQGIKLQRLKKVGVPLAAATALIALMVLAGCRALGAALGWPGEDSLVLAGILMISSTAVLRKSLRELHATHTRFGQTALTITSLDDLVAIAALVVLSSVIQVGQADSAAVLGTVLRLNAVIITLAVAALLLVPRLLNKLRHGISSEVRSLLVVGLLLGMALLSAKAGFSVALGAFLLGTVVSTTGQGGQVERVTGTLSDIFAPVFFVAMGMLFDPGLLIDVWPLALGVFVFTVVWRTVAATGALLMVGHPTEEAVRAAICLTPIGEFSLIIALTGVEGGLVPPSFYAIAIVLCLLTSLTTPVLVGRSHVVGHWIERNQPRFMSHWIGFYREWIENLKHRRGSILVWRLTAPRFLQVIVLVLFISGLLVFARPLYAIAEKWLGPDWPVANGLPLVFWFVFGLLVLAPLIALWRNMEALAMICAEAATQGRPNRAVLQPVFEKLLKGSASVAMLLWLAVLVPYEVFPKWGLAALVAAFVALAALFWRKLIRLHSRFEIELSRQLADSPFGKVSPAPWPKRNGGWKLSLGEIEIRENTRAVAQAISQLPLRQLFSCTIVSIERQGVPLPNPPADTVLYPNDKVLLLGRDDDLRRAEQWLSREPDPAIEASVSGSPLSELTLEHLTVPATSRHAGKALGELTLNSLFGVQVVGIERKHQRLLGPSRSETLQPGDRLLVLGAPEQVSEMAFWLST